ncbi:pentapeptide repeat-containing protein [Hyphomonas sp.]|uniref:pentapeptide repeat-containing protein n=1 Tax=Hyphomonas sp. TaxID=87 RepID=UPI0032D8E043
MGHNKRVPRDVIEWMGLQHRPIYAYAIWLGPFFGMILLVVSLVLAVASLVTLFHFFMTLLGAGPYVSDQSGEAIRNIGLVLAALLGAPLLVWRSVVVARQADIAAEALFNDKMNAAAQALSARREVTHVIERENDRAVLKEWEDDLVARVAAIDRLEGLVSENTDFAPRVVRLLATYIRGNFPCKDVIPTETFEERKTPRMDLQKSVDAIGRILSVAADVDRSHWRLDLKECDFDGVNFSAGFFRAVNFNGSRFEVANFFEGNFEGAKFQDTLLNYGNFGKAIFRGARFDRAILNRPQPVAGGMVRSLNFAADLVGATFVATDLTAIDFFGPPGVNSKTFGTDDTKLSNQVREGMLSRTDHRRAFMMRTQKGEVRTEEDEKRIRDLERTNFLYWSPFGSADGATGAFHQAFLEELGMNEWPYIG